MGIDKFIPQLYRSPTDEGGLNGKLSTEGLIKEFGRQTRIKQLLDEYYKLHPSDVAKRENLVLPNKGVTPTKRHTQAALGYVRGILLDEQSKRHKEGLLPASPNWKTVNFLQERFGLGRDTITKYLDDYLVANPNAARPRLALDSLNRAVMHYSPEAIDYAAAALQTKRAYIEDSKKLRPDGSITISSLVRELKAGGFMVSSPRLRRLLEEYQEENPDEKILDQFADPIGSPATYFFKDAADYVRSRIQEQQKDELSQPELVKKGWESISDIHARFKAETGIEIIPETIKMLLRKAYEAKNDFPQPERRVPKKGRPTYYPPEAIISIWGELSRIAREKKETPEEKLESAPTGWMTVSSLAQELDVNYKRVEIKLLDFVEDNPDSHPRRFIDEATHHRGKYYPSSAIEFVREEIRREEKEKTERGLDRDASYLTVPVIAKILNIQGHKVYQYLKQYMKDHPHDLRRRYPDDDGNDVYHYSQYAVSYVRQRVEEDSKNTEVPLAPESWKANSAVASEAKSHPNKTQALFDEYVQNIDPNAVRDYRVRIKSRNGEVHGGRIRPHFSSHAVEYVIKKITSVETAPEGWKTEGLIARSLQRAVPTVLPILNEFIRTHGESHRRKFHVRAARAGVEMRGMIEDHYSPEARVFVEKYFSEIETGDQYLMRLENQAADYFQDFNQQQELRELIALFGAAQNLDVLYALRPEFKDIPPEHVKGMIAEYLGSYLLSPAPFNPDKMDDALVHLKNDSLREGLREVIKSDCLHTVLRVRKANTNLSEKDLFDNYFIDLRRKCERYDSNPELEQTIGEVEAYYNSISADFKKPGERMVDKVRLGRKFPDLYQKINVKEISDKKRMLIADEMGVGKSASAILAKEELRVKTAVIVAPKNVISTWQNYLSDTVEDGKQIGYFRPGFAPRVLVINKPDEIDAIKQDKYDYILISQEKLSRDEYVEPLLRTEYDMLIIDEIHELKNVRAGKRSRSVLELADKIQGDNQYLALLSGTPVPNKVEDVAILLKLLHPEKFTNVEAREMIPTIIKGDLADLRTLLVPRMQMKSLAENVEMPKLIERTVNVPLSKAEEEIYQVLLDEDELTSVEKMHALRQFLVNPNLLNVAPSIPCSKLNALENELDKAFKTHEKVLVFVNDYIEDVIRGDRTIFESFSSTNEIKIETIHGGTSDMQREKIQKSFNSDAGKTLLFVSGSTAAVGVDYSGADHLIFYNEPWTKADKDQQRSRPYRPGLSDDLECVTILAENTIDEGIHRYIETKYNVINKLLKGIPITEFEQKLITESEKTDDQNLEVNAELARYYFSAFDKLNRMFASVKQIGEGKFQEWLEKQGEEYADFYDALGGRSYQANGSRVASALIQKMAQEKGIKNPRVLDIGSGPEMLLKHSLEKYQSNIFSADINEAQFSKSTSGRAVVASYASIPYANNTFDFINMSLVLDHTKFIPSKNEFERVSVLSEMARNLKVGGRGIINEVYSLDFEDRSKLPEVAVGLGLRVVEEYSGSIQSGEAYKSNMVTFEKVRELPQNPEQLTKNLPREVRDALKFKQVQAVLKNRRRIITSFAIGGKEIPIALNTRDRMLQESEQKILNEGETLKKEYGSIEAIPSHIVESGGFRRLGRGKYWILFKESDGSAIIVR